MQKLESHLYYLLDKFPIKFPTSFLQYKDYRAPVAFERVNRWCWLIREASFEDTFWILPRHLLVVQRCTIINLDKHSPTDLLYFSELALLLAVSLATDFDDKSFFSSKCRESRDKSTGYKSNWFKRCFLTKIEKKKNCETVFCFSQYLIVSSTEWRKNPYRLKTRS
mgnify:CR=1 FL=1